MLLFAQTAAISQQFVEFYVSNLRGNLFSGFLTLAAFLLSAKTFIVVHLQKELYGTADYQKRVRGLQQVDSRLQFYAPLRRLSRVLFWTILLSLIAAVAQLTIGLIPAIWASIVCILVAVAATVSFGVAFFLMSIALHDWFDQLEEAAEKEDSAAT